MSHRLMYGMTGGIFVLSLTSLLEGTWALMVLSAMDQCFPLKPDPVVMAEYFDFLHSAFRPEREMLLYRIWIVATVFILGCYLKLYRARLGEAVFIKERLRFLIVFAAWLIVAALAMFKIAVYQNPLWARVLLYFCLAGALGTKLFFPELMQLMPRLLGLYDRLRLSRAFPWLGLVAVTAGIIALLAPRDINACLGQILASDGFYHLDGTIMASGFAYLKGSLLNIDVISQYSVGFVVGWTNFINAYFGFGYESVVKVFIAVVICYWVLVFVFLRQWLNSFWLSAAAILLMIKVQMFHLGVAPLIWRFPSVTVLRYFWDIFFLLAILGFIRFRNEKYLWAAAFISGIALANFTDTGLYLYVGFMLLLGMELFKSPGNRLRKGRRFLGMALLSLCVGAGLLIAASGGNILKAVFWHNMAEFVSFFLNGLGTLPIYSNLKDGYYFNFFKGLLVPVIYLWVLFVHGARFLKQGWEPGTLNVFFSIYGLGLYHYYIARSAQSSYDVVGVPLLMIIFFLGQELIKAWGGPLQRGVKAFVFVVALLSLMTNTLFIYYPNVFNLSGSNWGSLEKAAKEFLKQDMDGALIKRYVLVNNPAAVISSFETKILMDADRKPFFYFYPLLDPPEHNSFGAYTRTYLHTSERVRKTYAQLEREKPAYIFVDKKLLLNEPPVELKPDFGTLLFLLGYTRQHYEKIDEGQYLVVFRRKAEE